VGAEDDVDPGGSADDGLAVLLGQAAAHGDLHLRVAQLGWAELAEVAVELVVRVLPDRAGVEDDDIGHLGPILHRGDIDIPSAFEHAAEPLRVVDVHLAPEGADLIASHRSAQAT